MATRTKKNNTNALNNRTKEATFLNLTRNVCQYH